LAIFIFRFRGGGKYGIHTVKYLGTIQLARYTTAIYIQLNICTDV